MQLSKRLTAVSGLVTAGYRLADVGTDHAYVPIRLVLDGRIPSAIAMDVNRGPLERARQHIREYGLEDRIRTRLSDGLEKLEPGEADTILAAGMGGMLTVRILKGREEVLREIRELILQPQSDIREVRLFLRDAGFWIEQEELVEEDGKYYPMLRAVPADLSQKEETYTEPQLRYGPRLLERRHPELMRYLQYERGLMERVREKLAAEPGAAAQKRLAEVEQSLTWNRQAREKYDDTD